MNQVVKSDEIVVVLSIGEDQRVTTEDQWGAAADELVAKHPGEIPNVTKMRRDAQGNLHPVVLTKVATVEAPKALAKAPVRGQTVSLEGAVRSGSDFWAAEDAGFAPKQALFTRGTMVIDMGVKNAKRSRMQHEAKPLVVEYTKDFIEKIKSEGRVDTIIKGADLRMTVEGEVGTIDEPQDLYLITERGLAGYCNRMGFGGSQYLERCWPELRAVNVNQWAKKITRDEYAEELVAVSKGEKFEPKYITTRHRYNEKSTRREIYGVVSDSYTAFDVDRVAEALMLATPPEARGTVTYDGYRAKFEVMFHSDVKPEDYVAGEFFKAGIIIRTDDVGGGAIRGMSAVWQNLCLNLIYIDRASQPVFAIRHIGDVNVLAQKFREGFKNALGKLEYFLKAWNYAARNDVVEELRLVEADLPADKDEVIQGIFTGIIERELVPVRGRATTVVPKLMEMWKKDTSAAAGYTRAAVINAVTRYAHEVNEDPWLEDEIQQAAGQLLYGRKENAKPNPFPYEPLEG